MNHGNILKRSWAVVWQTRALWLFGFLFALTGGGGGSFPSGSGSNGGGGGVSTQPGEHPPFSMPSLSPNTIVTIVVAAVAVVLLIAVVATVVRYVAETALVAGVDEMESTGAKLTVRRGFSLGWSRRAWRLFVTDFVIYVPVTLGGLLLVAIAALPFLVWLGHVVALQIAGSIIGGLLVVVVILALVALGLLLTLVMPYIRRRVVLAGQGVRAAVREGVSLARRSLADTGLMWLILGGLRIVWSIVMIPVFIVVVLVALVVGGAPAGVLYLLTHAWLAPAIVGGTLFVVVFVAGLSMVAGMFEAYTSTAWTLAYREVSAKLAA